MSIQQSVEFLAGLLAGESASFPRVEEVLEQAFSADTTSHNVSMPSTVNGGELLLIMAAISSVGAVSFTTPADWTELFVGQANAGQENFAVYAKVAHGNEDGTSVDVQASVATTMAAQVYRISNWFGSLSGVDAGFVERTQGTAFNPPSLSPSWGLARNLFIECLGARDDDQEITAASTNYSDLVSTISGGGGNAGCEVGSARRELEAASDDPDAMTLNSSELGTVGLIVVRPAA